MGWCQNTGETETICSRRKYIETRKLNEIIKEKKGATFPEGLDYALAFGSY
jgi:hypothetical protein